jgi:hypothetical protein
MKTQTSSQPEELQDDTSTPFVPDTYFRDFLAGKAGRPGQVAFGDQFQMIAAEMNRRLGRAQSRLLEAQNVRLEAQDKLNQAQLAAARSLERATWVLSIATVILAIATAVPVIRDLLR